MPVPDPTAERRRRRVILKGDVPSPVNPPSGCRFHTRCWLYERLGQPENCRTDDPPLRVLGGEHMTACHYAEEALKTDVGIAHISDHPVRRGTPDSAIQSLIAATGSATPEPVLETPAFAAEVGGTAEEEARETIAGDRAASNDMTVPGGTSYDVAPPSDKWHDPNDPSRRS